MTALNSNASMSIPVLSKFGSSSFCIRQFQFLDFPESKILQNHPLLRSYCPAEVGCTYAQMLPIFMCQSSHLLHCLAHAQSAKKYCNFNSWSLYLKQVLSIVEKAQVHLLAIGCTTISIQRNHTGQV